MDSFNKTHLKNIKCIFEEKTGVVLEYTPETTRHFAKRPILIAAVLVCFLKLTCYAVETTFGVGDTLKAFFSSRQENPLSGGQSEYLDQRIASVGECVTRDGVAVAVTAAANQSYAKSSFPIAGKELFLMLT